MPNRRQIREAVISNRGGLELATDTEIMMIWNSLDDETRKKYLESIKKGDGKNAVSS